MSDFLKPMDIQSVKASKPLDLPRVEGKKDADLKKAAEQFEGIFLDMVFKQMRSASTFENEFSDSSQAKVFREMLDSEYSKMSSQYQGLGIAEAMVRQLSKSGVDQQ